MSIYGHKSFKFKDFSRFLKKVPLAFVPKPVNIPLLYHSGYKVVRVQGFTNVFTVKIYVPIPLIYHSGYRALLRLLYCSTRNHRCCWCRTWARLPPVVKIIVNKKFLNINFDTWGLPRCRKQFYRKHTIGSRRISCSHTLEKSMSFKNLKCMFMVSQYC